MTSGLICKIISIRGKKVEVEIEGQKVLLSSVFMPKKISEGQEIKLYPYNLEDLSSKEKQLAKAILEEILNGK